MNKRMLKKRVDCRIDKFLAQFKISINRARRFRITLKKKPIKRGNNIFTLKVTEVGFDLFIEPIIDEFAGCKNYPYFEVINKEVGSE